MIVGDVQRFLDGRAERCAVGCPGFMRSMDTGAIERCDECARLNGVADRLADGDVARALIAGRAYVVTRPGPAIDAITGERGAIGMVCGCCIDHADTFTVIDFSVAGVHCDEIPECARCAEPVIAGDDMSIVHHVHSVQVTRSSWGHECEAEGCGWDDFS